MSGTTRKQRRRVVEALYLAEKPLTQQEIMERTGLSRPVVSRVLKWLLSQRAILRLDYKYEPGKPYRYLLASKLYWFEQILHDAIGACPVCGHREFHLESSIGRVSCRNCDETIIENGVCVVDPDSVEFVRQEVYEALYESLIRPRFAERALLEEGSKCLQSGDKAE